MPTTVVVDSTFVLVEYISRLLYWKLVSRARVRLLRFCSDVNWQSPQGDTPLLAACRNGHSPAALSLPNHGAKVNTATEDGQTALHFSCRRGDEAIAEALILKGADVLARNKDGELRYFPENLILVHLLCISCKGEGVRILRLYRCWVPLTHSNHPPLIGLSHQIYRSC